MSGFELRPASETVSEPQESQQTPLQQQAWRAGYGSVAPLAQQAVEGGQQQQQQPVDNGGQWRAGYNGVAPLAQQAVEGQVSQPLPTSVAPWRSEYNHVASLPQAPSDGSSPQSSYDGPRPWRGTYNNTAPLADQPVGSTPPYATGNPRTPIVYEPGTGGNPPSPILPPRYDTGTHGRPPSVENHPGPTPPMYNPNNPPPIGNPRGGTSGRPATDAPSTSDYQEPKDSVGVLQAAILGGAGGYLGGRLVPKYMDPLADRIANSPNDITTKTLLDSSVAQKFLPDSVRQKLVGKVESWPPATGENNPLRQLATGWQNKFNPSYANRSSFQDMLNSTTTDLSALKGKTGLDPAHADRLAELSHTKDVIAAQKAAGGPVEKFHGKSTYYKLRGEAEANGMNLDEVQQMGALKGKQDVLVNPTDGKLNQDLFNTAKGPDLLGDLNQGPLSDAEKSLVGKQEAYFAKAADAAGKNPKDMALLERPGVKEAVGGAALVGGSFLASSALDNFAGGPNALHLDNYAIPAAVLYGDSLGSKAALAGGAVVANFALDKMLPASEHATISNLMRPTGWDALMQGAAFMAPAADNKTRLATLGGAFVMGRLANMDTLPATAVAGTGVIGTAYALRANPELAIGAATLELGAYGVSRIMHAFEGDDKK